LRDLKALGLDLGSVDSRGRHYVSRVCLDECMDESGKTRTEVREKKDDLEGQKQM